MRFADVPIVIFITIIVAFIVNMIIRLPFWLL